MKFKEWNEIMRYAQNNGMSGDTVINAIKAYKRNKSMINDENSKQLQHAF